MLREVQVAQGAVDQPMVYLSRVRGVRFWSLEAKGLRFTTDSFKSSFTGSFDEGFSLFRVIRRVSGLGLRQVLYQGYHQGTTSVLEGL